MISRKLTVAIVVVALVASVTVALRGDLGNQTSMSTESSGGSLYTLAPSNTMSPGFVESGTAQGLARLGPNGSAVVITPSNDLPSDGYYPKRTFVSYDLTAKAGTVYTVFLYTKYNGEALLFGGYQAFVHGSSSSTISTIIDFVDGESYNATEPLLSLSSILAEGQIAVIFVPLAPSPTNSSSFSSLQVESVQTTWGLLPFGGSDLANLSPSGLDSAVAVSYMLILATAVPVLVSVLLWRRFKGRWMSPRTVAVLLVGAAAIRFALAPVTGFIDTDNFASTSSVYFSSGVFGVDWVSLPGFLYVELVSYLPYALLRNVGFSDWTVLAHSTFLVETVFVKIPSILADLGTGYLLSMFAERFRPNMKGPVLILYLFNPLTVYVSAVYGQFDTLFIFLFLATIYCQFVLARPLLKGFLLGATSIVNPVGFVLWIALLFFDKARQTNSLIRTYSLGALVFLAGLAPVVSQSSSVLQTTLERLMSAYPGDNVVGTSYNFFALGQLHNSSVGYGLTFRFLLELLGYAAGEYLYPFAAAGTFLVFAILMAVLYRKEKASAILSFLGFTLGAVALFEFFFPTIFLQFAIWPLALILCIYAVTEDGHLLPLVAATSLLTGVLYVVLVDKPFDRATGTGLDLLDPRLVNGFWAMIGLAYSALMIYVAVISIIAVRHAGDVTGPS